MSTTTPPRRVGSGFLKLDLPFGSAQPRALRVIIALIVAVGLSVAACWAIATAAVALMPSTASYEHFQFADYAKLTIIGVVIAAIAWPVVTLLSSHAHRLYLLADIVVVLVSFAPDLWIIRGGQPVPAVLVLMLMHVALGVITYPVMVYGAPQRHGPLARGR